MKKGDKVNTGKIEEAWVHGLEGEGVVGTKVVVLDLQHRLTRFASELGESVTEPDYDREMLTWAWILVISDDDHVWFARIVTTPWPSTPPCKKV